MPPQSIMILAYGVTSLWVLWYGMRDLPRLLYVLRRGRRTTGHIIREELPLAHSRDVRFPVVSFRDAAGVRHEFKSPYSRPTSYREMMGEVIVAYDSARPSSHAALVGLRYYWRAMMVWPALASFPVGMLLWTCLYL